MPRNNCLNISRLTKYNFKFISLEEVIVLEYLLHYYQRNNLDIVVLNRIELETGLKRSRLTSVIQDLKEKEFIDSKIEKSKTTFIVNIDKITNSLDKIFVNMTKIGYQYYLYVQNPASFKKTKVKKVALKKESKTKGKDKTEVAQMSLF